MDTDKSQRAVDLFDSLAEAYQEKYMDIGRYATCLDTFCDAIHKTPARILEVACGPGNVSKYLLTRRPDFQLLGTDLAPNMLELARSHNPGATFELLDVRKIRSLEDTYDGIICSFGLPYLSKTETSGFIHDAAERLNANGVLYISTMEDDYEKSAWQGPSDGGPARIFTHYHQGAYLIDFLMQSGMKVLKEERIADPDHPGPGATDLILIAQKTF